MAEEKEKKQKTAVRKRDGKTGRPVPATDKQIANTEEITEGTATIHLMVDGSKPVFPGLMFPLPFASGLQADTLREANASDHILGFVYTLNEESVDDQNKEDAKDQQDVKRIRQCARSFPRPETLQASCRSRRKRQACR